MFVSMIIVAGEKYRVLDVTTWSALSFVSASELTCLALMKIR